jgi:hypothetical protein
MFLLFPLGLFVIGAVMLIGFPVGFSLQSYFRNRGRRQMLVLKHMSR